MMEMLCPAGRQLSPQKGDRRSGEKDPFLEDCAGQIPCFKRSVNRNTKKFFLLMMGEFSMLSFPEIDLDSGPQITPQSPNPGKLPVLAWPQIKSGAKST